MWIIVNKELRELLYSVKYVLIFTASAALIFLSIYNGYLAYSTELDNVVTAEATALDELKERNSYNYLSLSTVRRPHKLSIFDQGITGIIGRKSSVSSADENTRGYIIFGSRTPYDDRYSADPVLAIFGELDLTYTVIILLSLFAFLLSYNAISGERESGTIRLIFANSTSRSSVIFGKLLGGFIPLSLIFIVPFLISLIALQLISDISFSPTEWAKIGLLAIAYLVYLFLFHVIGLATSAFSKSSFVSFMICLLIWITSVAIMPKATVQIASQINPAMTRQEFSSRISAYRQQEWKERRRKQAEYFMKNRVTVEEYNEKRRELYDIWQKEASKKRDAFMKNLVAEYKRKRLSLSETAVALSRISPTSCLTFITQGIAETGYELLSQFEDDIQKYERIFHEYCQEQRSGKDPIPYFPDYKRETDENGYIKIKLTNVERQKVELDLAGMPKFNLTEPPIEIAIVDASTDFTLIIIYSLVFLVISYVAFLRYDVR